MPLIPIRSDEKILHFVFAGGANAYGKCMADTTLMGQVLLKFKEMVPRIDDMHFFSEELRRCLTDVDLTLLVASLLTDRHSRVSKFKVYPKSSCYHCKRKSLEDKLSEKEFNGDIKICVKTLTGKIFKFCVSRADTIENIKEQIFLQGKYLLPVQQKLLLEGKELKNHYTVRDYNIVNGSELHLVLMPIEMMYRYLISNECVFNVSPDMKILSKTSGKDSMPETTLIELPDNDKPKNEADVIEKNEIDKKKTDDNCIIL